MTSAEQQFWDLCQFPISEEAPLITEQDLQQAIVEESEHFFVLNKPGWMVCHPSKNGPWSSLVGAVREWKQWDKMHLVARLDRETSGVVVLARHRLAARTIQMAMERREVDKQYLTILRGEFHHPISVYLPIGPDRNSPIAVRQKAWYSFLSIVCKKRIHSGAGGSGDRAQAPDTRACGSDWLSGVGG